MRGVEPPSVRTQDRRIVRLTQEVAAEVRQRRRIDAEERQERGREVGLPGRHGTEAGDPIDRRRPWQPDEERDAIRQLPRDVSGRNADRRRHGRVAGKAGVVIAEHDERRVVEQTVSRERGSEVFQRLIEKPHRVQIVAERGAVERAKRQHFVRVGKAVEGMVQGKRDEPRGKRPRQFFQARDHLLQKVVVVQAPPDLLGQLKVGLEQTLLEPVRRMHDAAVPESWLECHGRHRRIPVLGQHVRQADVVIPGMPKRNRSMVEWEQRDKRHELGIRRTPFARLIGDVREPQAVLAPTIQVRHHLLSVDAVIDHEVLQ